MHKIPPARRTQIFKLRLQGKSIPEIALSVGVGKTTVQRYVLNVRVPNDAAGRLRERQGGSKERAFALRANLLKDAASLLGILSERDYMLLLIGLYWGEGTKRDFEIINSDPFLIKTFIRCLQIFLKIPKNRLSLAVRVHDDVSVQKAKEFWASVTGLPQDEIRRIEVIPGKKKGKLEHGMCRIRVRSGIRDRLLVQSMISLIGKELAKV